MRRIIAFFTITGAFIFATGIAQAVTASSVTLAWNPSPSSNVAGYMIYYGTSSGNYISAVPVSNVTNVTIRGLSGGTTYYFAATSIDSAGNQSDPSPEISAAVGSTVITSQPSDQSVATGQTATFSIGAIGTGLSYQWTFNDSPIGGATGSSLTLNNVTAAQAGSYAVNVMSGSTGSVSSSPATLTVYPTAAANLAAAAAPAGQFAVAVSGVPGYQYIVEASTNLLDWVPLQTNIAPFNFVDPNAKQFDHRYYRTVYNPQ